MQHFARPGFGMPRPVKFRGRSLRGMGDPESGHSLAADACEAAGLYPAKPNPLRST